MNTSRRFGFRTSTLFPVMALAYLPIWLMPTPAFCEGTLVLSHTRMETVHGNGTSTITGNMRAEYIGDFGGDIGRDVTVGTGLKESSDPDFNFENLGSRVIRMTGLSRVFSCSGPSGCAQLTINVCAGGYLPTQYDQRSTASILRGTGSNYYKPDPLWDSNIKSTGCVPPPPPPPCVCTFDSECEAKFGPPPELKRWECLLCLCVWVYNPSPLVIHLPDYLSSKEGNQSWWKEGFCTAEAPTVCLDWRGDGNVSCTAWTTPQSETAFVVALDDNDMLSLADGVPVLAEPWRHFFGNVTMGPEGDFPFAHGFEALAARCNQDPNAPRIDLTECGHSLYAWADRSGDGVISPDELVELSYLGVETLGGVRTSDKTDKCGNTFAFESHATCAGRPGRCGTWLDVYFEPR